MPTVLLDKSPVDAAAEAERSAFNAAFRELGLRWYWDSDTYQALAVDPCERARVRSYLEGEQPHLLLSYDADFLADAVIRAKQRCRQSMTACAPRALPEPDWADAQRGEVGF